MTYTEDRETFEAQLFRPPHQVRMREHAGYFIAGLDQDDRSALLADALDRLWATRDQIHTTQDILRMWVRALEFSACKRPQWEVAKSLAGTFNGYKWVKGTQLGRHSL